MTRSKQEKDGNLCVERGKTTHKKKVSTTHISCVALTLQRIHIFCHIFLFRYTKATVSLAIASSSFVGTTNTFTFESGVEISFSSPITLFAS